MTRSLTLTLSVIPWLPLTAPNLDNFRVLLDSIAILSLIRLLLTSTFLYPTNKWNLMTTRMDILGISSG